MIVSSSHCGVAGNALSATGDLVDISAYNQIIDVWDTAKNLKAVDRSILEYKEL